MKYVKIQKEDFLPTHSKRPNYLYIVWIEAQLHRNFANNNLQRKFNNCLHQMAKFHEHTAVLALKKVWDPQDTNLFIKESCRYTFEGLNKYWEAVDRMIKFCDTILVKKLCKNQQSQGNSDKYHWKAQSDSPSAGISERRKLPRPKNWI